MFNICVFAGTTEGRRLVELLSRQDAQITACVATEYGGELIEPSDGVTVLSGRMDIRDMMELFDSERFDIVIDATHPYASAVTENLVKACSDTETEYLRLERSEGSAPENAVCVTDVDSAVVYLNGTAGNILFTTGSKELAAFSRINDFKDRAYARVLPVESSITACRDAGLSPAHIIAMQGPFSIEMNAAMIETVNADFVVTKESGKAGGFEEKAAAAKKADAKLVVIGRPEAVSNGISFTETIELLEKRFGFKAKPEVFVIGIGPGSRSGMTIEASEALTSAECLIGAKRMLISARPDQAVFEAVSPGAIVGYIREHREYSRFAVLMSGDVGFYSGAKKLLPKLDFCSVRIIPGVSSLVYLCAKTGRSYEDVICVSLHGRDAGLIPVIRRSKRVFVLVGGENGAGRLIDMLNEYGLRDVSIAAGERLGYADERIVEGTASQLAGVCFDPLACLLIENEDPESRAAGLPDEAFLRNAEDKPVVPMTKSEVRAAVMSKLRLLPDSVCWDIGAGTGSVTVEMALETPFGRVFAIEKKPEAIELLNSNISAFGLKNVEVVFGSAPEACSDLPAPSHAFIGGSSGNIRTVIDMILQKNAHCRITAAAVSLETVSELTAILKEKTFSKTEAVCMNVSKARSVGEHNLMIGQNPVYIFTLQN